MSSGGLPVISLVDDSFITDDVMSMSVLACGVFEESSCAMLGFVLPFMLTTTETVIRITRFITESLEVPIVGAGKKELISFLRLTIYNRKPQVPRFRSWKKKNVHSSLDFLLYTIERRKFPILGVGKKKKKTLFVPKTFNCLPKDKSFNSTKLKSITDEINVAQRLKAIADEITVAQMTISVFDKVGNVDEKGVVLQVMFFKD